MINDRSLHKTTIVSPNISLSPRRNSSSAFYRMHSLSLVTNSSSASTQLSSRFHSPRVRACPRIRAGSLLVFFAHMSPFALFLDQSPADCISNKGFAYGAVYPDRAPFRERNHAEKLGLRGLRCRSPPRRSESNHAHRSHRSTV